MRRDRRSGGEVVVADRGRDGFGYAIEGAACVDGYRDGGFWC
jgi:hypothetical protein